jgi:phosphoribosyl 1,2-cyclic phosphodiesterase
MIVRCWGARGSIPVSGEEYLRYGGDTTCLEIRTKNDEIIIIDAGTGIRRLGSRLLAEKRYAYNMLFTHAHWDHLMGFPFFKPIYLDKTSISVFGCPFAQTSVKSIISSIMVSPNFPVNFDHIKTAVTFHESCDTFFVLDTIEVTSISLSHPNQGVGYKFSEDGKSFVFLTDNELDYKHPGGLDYNAYVDFSYQADLLIHDAEFMDEDYIKTKTWGHSTYKRALQLAIDAKVKRFGLFHHNQERSDNLIDGIVDDCHKIIREQKASLECFAVHQDMGIVL